VLFIFSSFEDLLLSQMHFPYLFSTIIKVFYSLEMVEYHLN